MLNSPASDFRAEKRSKTDNPIVPQSSAVAQDRQEARSPHPHQDSRQERSPLPPHLDKLLDSAWSPEANRLVDKWLWYSQQEFELVGGAYE